MATARIVIDESPERCHLSVHVAALILLAPCSPPLNCRSSLAKVLRSPPASILSLLTFTASVLLAVARARLLGVWQHLWRSIACFTHRKRIDIEESAAVPA